MPIIDVGNMKVADLKRELKVRGLSVAGNKNELQERLQAALEGEPLLEDSSLVGEDILDEEGVLSDEEKILGADENELLKSPIIRPTTISSNPLEVDKGKASAIEDDILVSHTTTTKKVVLKRKNSLSSGTLDYSTSTTKENTEPIPAKTIKMSERNPITMEEEKKTDIDPAGVAAIKKLKELTMQERLELRAKKFGIDAKEAVAMTVKEKNVAISVVPMVSSEKQVELLKKRAERFGCVTSTNLAKLDAEERLLKRKERFGRDVPTKTKTVENNTTSAAVIKISSDNSNDEWAEKARKRLERFKPNTTTTMSVAAVSSATTTANST